MVGDGQRSPVYGFDIVMNAIVEYHCHQKRCALLETCPTFLY